MRVFQTFVLFWDCQKFFRNVTSLGAMVFKSFENIGKIELQLRMLVPGTIEYAIVQMDQRLFSIQISNAESVKQKTLKTQFFRI